MTKSVMGKKLLITSGTGSTPHIIYSSSAQEGKNTPYGQSKKEGRELVENWAQKNNARFSGLIIPNVYMASSMCYH